jgi:hypothetical protein
MHMTVTEYAEHRGCHPNAVQYAIQSGRISRELNGLIDCQKADVAWAGNTHAGKARLGPRKNRDANAIARAVATSRGDKGLESMPSFSEAHANREFWMGKLAELRFRESTGELVEKRNVEILVENRHRMLRQTLFQIPDRLASHLAIEGDEQKIHAILTAELERVLGDFAAGRFG